MHNEFFQIEKFNRKERKTQSHETICESCDIFEIGQSKKKMKFYGYQTTNTFFSIDHIAKQTKKKQKREIQFTTIKMYIQL